MPGLHENSRDILGRWQICTIGEILVERIRLAVQDFPSSQRSITVNIGEPDQAGWQIRTKSLFKSADEALCRAKAKGRNRVEKA